MNVFVFITRITVGLSMNVLKSQYNTNILTQCRGKHGLEIRFGDQDYQIAELCLRKMNEAFDHVETFFDYSPGLKLFIFMYPELSAMNRAFGRELPDENCCFVPIKGPESLIAFVTPRNGLSSLKMALVHEYCHIVFGCLTGNREVGPYDQRIPMWLDEGLALFVDREFRENFPEAERKRLNLLRQGAGGWWPDLEHQYTYFNRLDGAVEFGPRGMLAYAYSYFCVKELMNRFGKQTVVDFLASLASCSDIPSMFRRTFGMTIAQFNSEMKSALTERFSVR
jgi:hypothetical protein